MAELVVDPAFLVVREHLVGLVDLLELRLGLGVAGVAVGVVLEGLAPVGLPQVIDRALRGRTPRTS